MYISNNFQRITTKYNNTSTKIVNYQINNNTQNHNNVQFQGLPTFLKFFKKAHVPYDYKRNLAYILDVPPTVVKDMTKDCSETQFEFFDNLVNMYNAKNFGVAESKRENPQLVFEIFKKIKSPTDIHFQIIRNKYFNFETLSNLLKNNVSNKELQFITDIKNSHKIPNSDNLIFDILNSKNRKKIIDNFQKYKSFFILNKENKNVVQELDRLINSSTYNANIFDKKLKVNNLMKLLHGNSENIITKESLEKNFTEDGYKLFNQMPNFQDLYIGIKNEYEESKQAILNILKSTNKKNFKTRTEIITDYANSTIITNNPESMFIHLDKLFTQMDNDKNVRNFVKKLNCDHEGFAAEDINEMLDKIPSRKLNIFVDNVRNILFNTTKDKRIDTLLKEIENPLYAKNKATLNFYDEEITQSIFSKANLVIRNKFNQAKYRLLETINPQKTITKPKLTIKKSDSPIVVETNTVEEEQHTIVNIQSPIVQAEQPIIEIQKSEPNIKIANRKKCSLKILKAPKSINSKKLAIINDVNNIIKSKLSTKTYDEQNRDFALKATKMRLSLLPEMFESVKETRKIDRLIGKKKSNSANKDVLELYEKINGKNKKLVNYMLKKRNVDGSRMFEIKDIINTLDKSGRKIKNSSIDAKTYYNHLLDSKIEQYGKLSRKKFNNK